MSKSQQILLVIVLACVLVIVGLILNTALKATDPTPPKTEDRTQRDWINMLSNSTWNPDKRTKDVRLREFGRSKIEGLWFQVADEDGSISVILVNHAANFKGKAVPGDEVLTLTVDGNHLDLWYSESEAGLYPTLTIKGKEEKLFFNPAE